MRIFSLVALLCGVLLARECYRLYGRAGAYTPVPPHYIRSTLENITIRQKGKREDFIEFPTDWVYFGCFDTKEALYRERQKYDFWLKDERVVRKAPRPNDLSLIVPSPSGVAIPSDLEELLERYTPQRYLERFPKRYFGDGVEFLSIGRIPYYPLYNLFELKRFYDQHHFDDRVLVLHHGVYSLESLYKKVGDESAIARVGPDTYEINVPLYISKNAALVIRGKRVLLQSSPKPVMIIYDGDLYIAESQVVAWDRKKGSYHKRTHIPKEEILLIGQQRPRPYLLGFSGSRTYFLSSTFKGLGFHSTTATFGVSVVDLQKPQEASWGLLMAGRQRHVSEAVLIGNEFSDLMIGFFSNHVDDVVLVGNYYHDNLIYNIDPHDYGENILIARNITTGARFAHGIVLSRQINRSIITQNISFANHSVGIMLDRNSEHNLIYDNLVYDNGVSGITIQESDHSLSAKNSLFHNAGDGILVRNSLASEIIDNTIAYNLKNGIEVFTKNIDDTIYRDFLRDPYHKATAAIVGKNRLIHNFASQILSKNSAAVELDGNQFADGVAKRYDGDLQFFADVFEKRRFRLYGMGYPYSPLSVDKKRLSPQMLDMLEHIYCDSANPKAITFLGEVLLHYKKRDRARKIFVRQIYGADPRALYAMGFTYFRVDDGKFLRHLVQSAIMGHKEAIMDVSIVPYTHLGTKEVINEIYAQMVAQMKEGRLWPGYEVEPAKRRKIIFWAKRMETLLRLHKIDFFEYTYRYAQLHKRVVTPAITRRVLRDFDAKNILKILHFQKEAKGAKKRHGGRKELRKKFVQRSWEELWRVHRDEALQQYLRLARKYLKKINRHRLHPISLEQILPRGW